MKVLILLPLLFFFTSSNSTLAQAPSTRSDIYKPADGGRRFVRCEAMSGEAREACERKRDRRAEKPAPGRCDTMQGEDRERCLQEESAPVKTEILK